METFMMNGARSLRFRSTLRGLALVGWAVVLGGLSPSGADADTGGPDAFGYVYIDSNEPGGPVYNFEDISGSGTFVGLGDDQVSGALPIGFVFSFYGVPYSNVYISSNGFMTFLAGQSQGCCTGQAVPTVGSPDAFVSAWWEDLYPPGGVGVHYQTLGSSPNQRLIVQWNVPHYPSVPPVVTMQIKLFEGSNNIEVHYSSAGTDGGLHTAGIEDPTGAIGLQYRHTTAGLATPLAVLYSGCDPLIVGDTDLDGVADPCDNCPNTSNPGQEDGDGDGIGDVCDACPMDAANDADSDGFCANVDNCPLDFNPGQENADGDAFGDACELRPICVIWLGDETRHHSTISGPSNTSGGGPQAVPDSITFEMVNAQCGQGGTWSFYLNNTLLGTQPADPGNNCSCYPPLQTFVVSNPALLNAAWDDTGGPNNLRAVRGSGSAHVAWVRANINTGGVVKTVPIFDFDGGSSNDMILCSANYTNKPVDATVPATQSAIIDLSQAQLKGVIKSPTTSTIYYQWDFDDGPLGPITPLSGSTKYEVTATHQYTGFDGDQFTAQLCTSGAADMSNATCDDYLIEIRDPILDVQVNIVIDRGLWYLYTHPLSDNNQIHLDPSVESINGQPVWAWRSYSTFDPCATGSAIQAFQITNHKETADPNVDPYAEAVAGGLNWLMNGRYAGQDVLRSIDIGLQTYGNPDTNGNNKGIEVGYAGDPPYQGGMVMDGIISSETPGANSGRDFDGDSFPDTYGKVIQDMADAYAWGQGDGPTGDQSSWDYNWNTFATDNSTNQWAAIGLIPAQDNFGSIIPQFVKDRDNQALADYPNGSFHPGVSERYWDYRACGLGCLVNGTAGVTRPSGMVQMILSVPNYEFDYRWVLAESWFADNFDFAISVPERTYYGWLSFVKAMRLSNTQFLTSGRDWYRGNNPGIDSIAERLVDEHEIDGSWPDGGQRTHPGFYGETFVTSWAIQMLRPVLFASTVACCDHAQVGGVCTDDVLADDCVGPQLEFFTMDCAAVEAAGLCEEHTGACCDRRIADPLLRCRDGIPQSQCIIDDPDQVSWTKATLCAELDPPCTEHTGACCDGTTGTCIDGVPQSLCPVDPGDPDNQYRWEKDTLCIDLDPACTEHTGACCDQRFADPVQRCRDNVPESLCVIDDPSQVSWTKDTLCANLSPPCTEHTGACCNRAAPGGTCTDNVPDSQCPQEADPQYGWYKDETCAAVEARGDCLEHTGACCDADAPGGDCEDGVPASQCNTADPQITWTKDTLCVNLSPACAEHTGACCDASQPGGSCANNVPESMCNTADPQITWTKSTLCANLVPPCSEHTGACCVSGTCVDNVPESSCLPGEWTKDTLCADLDPPCSGGVIPTVSEWGLVVLALLLLVGAKVHFSRREAVA